MTTEITIKPNIKLGPWQGIGGAITEATAYNFAKLSPKKQRKLLDAYYNKRGLDYRWGRISIGSNDFCLKPYEYTSTPDLSDFSIEHDRRWLLPMLKKILAKKDLNLIASPWSPPKCMKFTLGHHSILKPWHYQNYANYLCKWLKTYAKNGVNISYLTPQNEPHAAQIWESCLFSCRSQRKFAYKYLTNALNDLDTQILLWDHNKKTLSKTADKLFSGKHVTDFGHTAKIAGLCYHWYDGTFPDQMWQVRQKYPDIIMLSSEMSCGFSPYNKADWQKDANLYLKELFANINSGASAFIDWNMLLDYQGGPSYCHNYLKSPIILNPSGNDFILTPIYHALKRFAKLFPVGSQVIRCEFSSDDIVAIARKTKFKRYKVIIANLSNQPQSVIIKLGKQKKSLTLKKYEVTDKCGFFKHML